MKLVLFSFVRRSLFLYAAAGPTAKPGNTLRTIYGALKRVALAPDHEQPSTLFTRQLRLSSSSAEVFSGLSGLTAVRPMVRRPSRCAENFSQF